MNTKSLEEWERQKNKIIKSESNAKKKLTEEQFDKLAEESGHSVNYADREQFLKDNGYELTRENFYNNDLSARQT